MHSGQCPGWPAQVAQLFKVGFGMLSTMADAIGHKHFSPFRASAVSMNARLCKCREGGGSHMHGGAVDIR